MSVYISRLRLNGAHPRTRSELHCPYELHRTVCKAWENPEAARVLFRPEPGSQVLDVIVQGLTAPNWSRAALPKDYLLGWDGPKEIDLQGLERNMKLAFRLRCRPSKRAALPGHQARGTRRALVERRDTFRWLDRKAEENEFCIVEAAFDRVYWFDSKYGKQEQRLGGVVFDGILAVTDPQRISDAVANGIGTQKAFGFGLLSLAPIRDKP